MQSSYDLLLQQQQLFLQWQREVEESRALCTSQVTLKILSFFFMILQMYHNEIG